MSTCRKIGQLMRTLYPYSRGYSGMLFPTSHSLRGEKNRQFLTPNKETIVCVHPAVPADISGTKLLFAPKPGTMGLRDQLPPDEVALIRKLRREDPELWTLSVLSKLFNATKKALGHLAPITEVRREDLAKAQEIIRKLKPYKRKILLAEQAMKRDKKLKEVIAQNKYNFPGKL